MGALALIPARGGSKSIPRKNIRPLSGHPLIAYSIAAAKAAALIERIIVSTEDEEIAEVARAYGAETPFIRPTALAADDTEDLPVFQHALKWLKENEGIQTDIIVHLRPTAPFRNVSEIDHAVQLLVDHPEAHSVRGVSCPETSPFKMYKISQDHYLRPLFYDQLPNAHNMPRQKLPPIYRGNAAIDVVRRETVMELGSMTGTRVLPWLIDEARCIDIDTISDWEYAEWLIETERRHVPPVATPKR